MCNVKGLTRFDKNSVQYKYYYLPLQIHSALCLDLSAHCFSFTLCKSLTTVINLVSTVSNLPNITL